MQAGFQPPDAGLATPKLTVRALEELNIAAHQLMIFLYRAVPKFWPLLELVFDGRFRPNQRTLC
jgi:hypothetical protein